MKKFINQVDTLLDESLNGFAKRMAILFSSIVSRVLYNA